MTIKESDTNSKTDSEHGYNAHTSCLSYHFLDLEVEFNFQWVLGSTIFGGCEIGEAFYVANQIESRSDHRAATPENWQEEWRKMAELLEINAKKYHKKRHFISAREAYLKAANYYRASVMSMPPYDPNDPERIRMNPEFIERIEKFKECFMRAGTLFDPPIEFFKFQDESRPTPITMPGYFIRAPYKDQKAKTLIMVGGGETFMEELYFYIAPAAHARGYNFISLDLPGQGMMSAEGYTFKEDTENQMKPLLSYIEENFYDYVDMNKIAAYGISQGGYFVPRAATREKRIKAIAVSNAITDNWEIFKTMPFATDTEEQINQWPRFKYNMVAAVAWRWGVPTDLKKQVDATKNFQFDPREVDCPFLDLVASLEYKGEVKKQQKFCYDYLSSEIKEMILSPEEQGASSHCICENRSWMAETVLNFFDDVFDADSK